jgi:hypothetical protein
MPPIYTKDSFAKSDVAKTPKSAVTIGAADAAIVPTNADRVEVTICNDHATQTVYLALGAAAVANQGIRLNAAGGSYTTQAFTGEIRGIASGAGTVVTFSEV